MGPQIVLGLTRSFTVIGSSADRRRLASAALREDSTTKACRGGGHPGGGTTPDRRLWLTGCVRCAKAVFCGRLPWRRIGGTGRSGRDRRERRQLQSQTPRRTDLRERDPYREHGPNENWLPRKEAGWRRACEKENCEETPHHRAPPLRLWNQLPIWGSSDAQPMRYTRSRLELVRPKPVEKLSRPAGNCHPTTGAM